MAADDAVSLLRSLKAAGGKTGAVEAEGALHLRRNSRRTMDGLHDAAAPTLQGGPAFSLPAPKYQPSTSSSAIAITSTVAATNGTSSGGLGSPLSFSSAPIPMASSPAHNTSVNGANGNGNSNGGSLPAIASIASSPIASPSRLSARPPGLLMSLPSPTASSPGGGGAAGAANGGPPSPPCPTQSHLSSPSFHRRSIHAYSCNGGLYDAVQLPHSHGSPLPLLFDPPVSLPPPAAAATAAAAATSPGVSSPSSPGNRCVQLSGAMQLSTPLAGSSLPSLAIVGNGAAAAGSGGLPPSVPMPSLLPSTSIRTVSGRCSLGGAVSNMLAAAATGGGSSGSACAGAVSSTLSKSHPIASGAVSASGASSLAGTVAAPSAAVAGGRALRPPSVAGSPFGLPLAAAAAAGMPPSPGSPPPSASSPVPSGLLASPNGGHAAVASVLFPLTPGAAQAALQLQLAVAAQPSPAPLVLQKQLSARPSSARSVAGGGGSAASESLNAMLTSRRLSMTGTFEAQTLSLPLAAAPSQKLVLAAAHELQHAQLLHHNSTIKDNNNNNNSNSSISISNITSQSGNQPQQAQPLQLQLLLPPTQLQSAARPSITSARGPSITGPGAIGGSSGAAAAVAAAGLPRVLQARDTRSSDPGMFGSVPTVAAALSPPPPEEEFGFPTAEPSPAGRPSLLPLPITALQAVRAATPPAAVPTSVIGWPLGPPQVPASSPQQLNLRAPRPEPLPQRPEPPQQLPPAAAVVAALSEPLQPRSEPPLPPLPEPLPPLLVAAGGGGGVACPLTLKATAVPLGRANTLAPLQLPEELLTTAAGPVAESALDSRTPDLDPAALFGPCLGSGSKTGVMELTVRSMAMQPATPPGAAASSNTAGDRFAVQSSVRQRLQTDPLRFHPPAAATAGAARRHSSGAVCLDPLEATPRLVPGVAGGPPMRTGRGGSPRTTAAGGGGGVDALWAPSQDILPHMVSRGSGSGGSSGGGGSRLCFSPSVPTPAAVMTLHPITPGLELPPPRLRSNSTAAAAAVGVGGGGRATCEGAPFLARTPSDRPPPPVRQHSQRVPGGLQSNYLQALAAAAGLDGGSGSGSSGAAAAAGPRLRRQRSLSDSGCASFLAAAADSGPVGLPLEGGLAVIGDMLARVRAERNHNTRYSVTDAGDISGTLEDSTAKMVVTEVTVGAGAKGGPSPLGGTDHLALRSTSTDGAAAAAAAVMVFSEVGASSGSTGASIQSASGDVFIMTSATVATISTTTTPPAITTATTTTSSLTGSSSGPRSISSTGSGGGGVGSARVTLGSVRGGQAHGTGQVRLDASVSSLPLKALLAAATPVPPPGIDGGAAASTSTASAADFAAAWAKS